MTAPDLAPNAVVDAALHRVARARLATLPTPLESGPLLPNEARLWVKRDDLTGLGGGGNKARKLEFLCGEASEAEATALITVGAAQSNHCRMTAAAGTLLGFDVHLVLSGDRPVDAPTGNQLLSTLFGANRHHVGCPPSHWGELEIARESLAAELAAEGVRAHSIPIGGSTPTGALGYLLAYFELLAQFVERGVDPTVIVHTTSSGGTHAGLVAGRALARAHGLPAPPVLGVAVARGVAAGMPDIAELATDTLDLLDQRHRGDAAVTADDIDVDARWVGDDYDVPTDAGDAAIRWAAGRGGWILDRTYTGKGFAGVLGGAADRRWGSGDDVVFIHTGGWPALFAPEGSPPLG